MPQALRDMGKLTEKETSSSEYDQSETSPVTACVFPIKIIRKGMIVGRGGSSPLSGLVQDKGRRSMSTTISG